MPIFIVVLAVLMGGHVAQRHRRRALSGLFRVSKINSIQNRYEKNLGAESAFIYGWKKGCDINVPISIETGLAQSNV
jgi:hypothetical protein